MYTYIYIPTEIFSTATTVSFSMMFLIYLVYLMCRFITSKKFGIEGGNYHC